MNGERHTQNVQRYDYELTLGLDNQCVVVVVYKRAIGDAKTMQLLHGQDTEHDLDHNGQQVAHEEYAEGDRLAQGALKKGDLITVRIRIGRDVEEGGVALGPSDEVRGRVDHGTCNEHTEAERVRRLGAEAAQPCDQKREALEGDQNVEHVLEEVESGGGAQDHAAVVACGQLESEREVARREAHEREGHDERAEHTVERVYAQVLIYVLVVGGESGKAEQTERHAHQAEWREHEQEERVEQPRRVYLLEQEQLLARCWQTRRIHHIVLLLLVC